MLDADGNTVMVAGGIVEWTYALEAAGKHLVRVYEDNPGIDDGDQFVFNDSYLAAVHHMDIQVLVQLIAFIILWEAKVIFARRMANGDG